MKKVLCAILALMIVLSMTAAFATDSKTADDIPSSGTVKPGTSTGNSTVTEENKPGIAIILTEDSDVVAALKETSVETVYAAIPAAAVEQLGDMTAINEINTIVTVGAENVEVIPDLTSIFAFVTPYEPGTVVKAFIATDDAQGEEIDVADPFKGEDWVVLEGNVNENGEVVIPFAAAWVETIINTATMIIFSK